MATYDQQRTIKEYWERDGHKYPGVTFAKFEEACKFPAIFIKGQIKSGKLLTIMVKYLGKFIVYPKRVRQEINSQGVFLEGKHITEEVYNERVDKLKDFLIRFEQEYNTYELLEDIDEEGDQVG